MNESLLTDVGLAFLRAFSISLGIGLLMGLERERHASARAGLRTFALTALFGTTAALLSEKTGSPWVLAAGLVMVGAMMLNAYRSHPDMEDPGTTSVIALLLCYGYGAMMWYGDQTLAVMLGIVSTVLLYFKSELQTLSQRLTRRDLISVLQFCVLSLVILPILPNRDFGPYQAINLAQTWWMVVLIAGVSLAGYGALRIVGQQHGAPLLGVLGGLASSTATTLVFSRHARDDAAMSKLALVVILTANLIVLPRLGVYAAVVQPGLLAPLAPVVIGGVLFGIGVVVFAWHGLKAHAGMPQLELRNPTEIRTAIGFGVAYAVVLLVAAALTDYAGSRGIYAISLVSGLTDVDAITLSTMRLYGMKKLSAAEATTSILIAFLANLSFKLGIVLLVAGPRIGGRVAAGFLTMAGGAAAGWMLFG